MAEAKHGVPADRSAEALGLHAHYRGKMQTLPKVPVRSLADYALWYTPGVAAPSLAIAGDPEAAFAYTNRGNSIAIVSDGSRVLGLGNIGPAAGLPVMEGKALLFKLLGGVDATPLCLRVATPDDIVRAVEMIEPSFGGINLEDIAHPQCFRVLDEARRGVSIPVWHDDQQGSATVVLAGLIVALERVGKTRDGIRIVLFGAGAANIATYRLLCAYGFDPRGIVACDTGGILHRGRHDIEAGRALFPDKWRICCESNGEGRRGSAETAFPDADVCIAFSRPGPGTIAPGWISRMARDAVVFACANPVPEIWPAEAHAAGARIVATGRSDFPNQVNNALVFPGMFRGVLDVRARTISDRMTIAVAEELAACARETAAERLLPTMEDWTVAARIAAAAGEAAIAEGLAQEAADRPTLLTRATDRIAEARAAHACLMQGGAIGAWPAKWPGARENG